MYQDVTFHFIIWNGKYSITTHESFWLKVGENVKERIEEEMEYHIGQLRKYKGINVKKYFAVKASTVENGRIVELDLR